MLRPHTALRRFRLWNFGLEAAVRHLGLWDDVSDLSLSKLGKALAEDQLPPAARAKLAPFATSETRVTIGLRKKRDAEDR